MKKKHHGAYIFLILVLMIFLAAIAGAYYWDANLRSSEQGSEESDSGEAVETESGVEGSSKESTDEKDNEPESISSKSGNVTVMEPQLEEDLEYTFTITGFANVFEGTVMIRVKDANGKVLKETFTTAESSDIGKTGPFEVTVTLDEAPETETGTVEVYTESPKDGSEQDLVEVEVTFE